MTKDLSKPLSTIFPIPSFNETGIVSAHIGSNKKTKEKFAMFTNDNGQTKKFTESKEGVCEEILTKIPQYTTKEKRDKIIHEQSKKNKTQADIAAMLNISQSTVSNVLKKKKKKKKKI